MGFDSDSDMLRTFERYFGIGFVLVCLSIASTNGWAICLVDFSKGVKSISSMVFGFLRVMFFIAVRETRLLGNVAGQVPMECAISYNTEDLRETFLSDSGLDSGPSWKKPNLYPH